MLVTTVIPTYNRARDVVRAVESATAQTYPADLHEIIVVDDGSTDGTAETLRERFGDRIRVLRKENGGVSAARNHGIAHACGDVIALLDSDDTWHPEKLVAQTDVLRRRPDVGMVLTSALMIDVEGRPCGLMSRRATLPVDGHVLPYVLRNPIMVPSTAVVRTSVARGVGGFDEQLRTAEDLKFHLQVACRYPIAVIERPLVYYLKSEGLSASVDSYADQLRIVEEFVLAHSDELDKRHCNAALFRAHMRTALGLTYYGHLDAAVHHASLGARYLREARELPHAGRVAMRIVRAFAAQYTRPVRERKSRASTPRA
jgi:glycosyltransferase involved in cell wall biosynthesis